MTEHFSPKSQRSLPLTLHKALSKVKGKSLRSFCLVTCLQRWCFQQRTRGHEHPSVHLPRPPRTPSMQLHPRGGPSAAAPSQPGVPGSPGTRPPPSAGRRGLVGLLELGLSLCTLRVWGPFGSQGRVGVLCRTGLGSRDASPLGTYLFLTPPPPLPQTRRRIREGGALPGSRRHSGPAEPRQRPEQVSRPPEPPGGSCQGGAASPSLPPLYVITRASEVLQERGDSSALQTDLSVERIHGRREQDRAAGQPCTLCASWSAAERPAPCVDGEGRCGPRRKAPDLPPVSGAALQAGTPLWTGDSTRKPLNRCYLQSI